ncbi:hypothetical protein PVNG_02841 [Plasmodium vivax North Korean]|uniref:Uncharacterized protein n=1 Tax=Plasmodium vivax North Korean TaxID=1035514 RepID=A0A0J9TML2_PLAVI|nr:hypothetical protein PVNG_02841 [Plasmodium vivax North Korean]
MLCLINTRKGKIILLCVKGEIKLWIINALNMENVIEAEEQIPYKFYSRLNDYEDASKLEKLNSKSAILPFVTDNEGRIILAQLARNIELIVSKYPENYVKRCRDINYWLNDKIKKYEEKTGQNISSEALTVFNDIKWKKGGKDVNVCQQNPEPYGTKHVDLMKNLDDYFEIRDNNGCNALKNKNECLKYNEYIRERKEYFSSEINHKCSTPVCNRNNYKINDYCSLNNIDDTFPEINCEVLYKKEVLQETVPTIRERSPLEIGFFIIVSFILFYLFIYFIFRESKMRIFKLI